MSSTLTILTFHSLDDARTGVSFSPALFERLVRVLGAGGYAVVSLPDAVKALRDGAGLPRRPLAITFDDGDRSVHQVAFPILRQLGWPATVFLKVGDPSDATRRGGGDPSARLPSWEGREMLSWGEIREMQGAGVNFGAHTLTHPDLTRLPTSDVEREMVVSKAVLGEALGESVTGFAYPFGRYDARSLHLARRHFAYAVSDRLAIASAGSDLHALPRVDRFFLSHPRLVDLLAEPWFPWYIRACNVPRTARRALRTLLRQVLGRD